jgi:two-component system, chemotaxis family, CheB/CheR fusion protein
LNHKILFPQSLLQQALGLGWRPWGLDDLFTAPAADTGLGRVIVMHLPPDWPSLLADFLRRLTAMQVLTFEDGMPLLPNTIRVPPPGKHLIVNGGRFAFCSREADGRRHHPIDRFFESLAADLTPAAVAAVLSGFGADGSDGEKNLITYKTQPIFFDIFFEGTHSVVPRPW